MSDGGQQQRVLDLIDDPNALESFLGGLTSDSELLPSAESVDNVVASLARSLEADYEVDSPNETLFDSLVSSSNLTDISQSYVPSDFENAINNAISGVGVSLQNGEVSHQILQQQQQQQQVIQNSLSNIVSSGVEQFLLSSQQQQQANGSVASTSIGSLNVNSTVTTSAGSTLHQQFDTNCDASSSNSQFIHQNQLQLNQSQQVLLDNNGAASSSFSFSQDFIQKQSIVNINQSQQQQQQLASLSSVSLNQNHHLNPTDQSLASISSTLSGSSSTQSQSVTEVSHLQTSVSNAGGGTTTASPATHELLPNNSSNNIVSANPSTATTSILQAQSQFLQQSATQQQQTAAAINQIVSGQTVSLGNLSVGGAHQLLATSTGNIVTTSQGGQNIIQQIQAGNGQGYITLDQSTLMAPTFGAANLALVATGSTPAYAVVNTGAHQFLQANTIMTQPQTIQTLAKGPGGTYFQTAGGAQIVATAPNVSQLQNVNVSPANNNTNSNKPKQPPQLLPKPQTGTANAGSANNAGSESEGASSNTSQQTSTASAERIVTHQILQPQQATQQIQGMNQVVVTSVGNTVIPQQSFTIAGAHGLGQGVMIQSPSPQQLIGNLVVNQYGQPMLVPSAAQTGLQFIVRPQTQVLTLQTQGGATAISTQAAGGKPVVRYVSQMSQMAQSGYGLQQIQTANGPAWVAVRYPSQAATTTIGTIQSQVQNEIITSSNLIPTSTQQQIFQTQVQVPPTPTPPPPPPTPPQQTVPQSTTPQPPPPAPTPPQSSTPTQTQPSQTTPKPTPKKKKKAERIIPPPEPPPVVAPPPAKKSRAKPKPKKVTLDLEQLLKQSGIMDEDLQDDSGFDFSFGPSDGLLNGSDMSFHSDYHVPTELPLPSTEIMQPDLSTPTSQSKGKSKGGGGGGGGKRKSGGGGGGGGGGGSKKKKRRSPTPPPPPPPPKSKSKKKGGGGGGGGGGGNQSQKTDSKGDATKKMSSMDDIMETINAVARAPYSPSPPRSPEPLLSQGSPASSFSHSASAPPTPSSPAMSAKSSTPAPQTPQHQNPSYQLPVTPSSSPAVSICMPPAPTTPNGINNMISSQTGLPPPPPGTTRIIQTIQLTPQNQQLLRNIQAQITRLYSLSKRNETEQTALSKLIVLQQQVIATGIPVPNPTHITHLAQNATCSISSSSSPSSSTSSNPAPSSASPASSTSANGRDPVVNTSSSGDIVNPSTTPTPSITLTPSNQNVLSTTSTSKPSTVLPSVVVELSADNSNDLNGNFLETMAKIVDNTNTTTSSTTTTTTTTDSTNLAGTTEEDKENASSGGGGSGGANLVVTSSALASGTNTTNSLGQHPVQSFPPTFRSNIDEKKAEEQRQAVFRVEEEKRCRWKKEEFEMLLKRDQQCVTQPDYEIPFTSQRDAVERLMKYHILRDRNDMNFEEFDYEFGEKAGVLLDKFHAMGAKYRSLLLKESMKEVGCAERVMLERMFVTEEKMKLEQDRLFVGQGEFLELPPPPIVWVPKIEEMVEKELKEMEQDTYVNMQVQSAIDSIIGFGTCDNSHSVLDEMDVKIEYDAFGVPINNNHSGFGSGMMNTSSADIDEAVRSILS